MCWMCTQEFPDAVIPADIHANPHQVGVAASELSATGEALRDAARRLRTLANDELTVSLAIDEVRERARETVTTVDKVAGRYEDAGSALATYRSKLDDALGRLRAARAKIDSNNDDSRWQRHRRWELERELQQNTIDADGSAELVRLTRTTNQYENSSATHQSYASTAREDIRTAALIAAGALDDAADTAGLNDGFWDAVGGVLQVAYEWSQENLGPILEIIRDVLKVLKSILDIICLIVTVAVDLHPHPRPARGGADGGLAHPRRPHPALLAVPVRPRTTVGGRTARRRDRLRGRPHHLEARRHQAELALRLHLGGTRGVGRGPGGRAVHRAPRRPARAAGGRRVVA